MNDASTLAALTLAFTPGLGPRKIKLLIDHFGTAQTVCEADAVALKDVEGIGPKLVAAIMQARANDKAAKELERAAHLKTQLIALGSVDYPEALQQIYDPPTVLYVRGHLPASLFGALNEVRAVGIVGTRKASPYALDLARMVGRQLAERDISVVSGLALGVDSAAHEGAISAATGQTVAVLGSGVDTIYPRQNGRLAERILDGHGAIISEYPIGTQPRAENFPGRNRIINGFSRGVMVVEAGNKSGALITADFAMEEGRSVFAVPGRVGDPRATGVLELLKQGACLLQSAEDILNEFGWNSSTTKARAPHTVTLPQNTPALHRQVIEAVKEHETALLDNVIETTGLTAAELLPVLGLLELKGILQTMPGGRYRLVLGQYQAMSNE